MAINIGKPSTDLENIYSKVSDLDILHHYFGITHVPCMINSPLRRDNNPSLSFYSKDGIEVLWTDFSTKEGGDVIHLMSKYWGESYADTVKHLWEDLPKITNISGYTQLSKKRYIVKKTNVILKCKVREWKDYDLEFWNSFGISKRWLEYADVYPISHKIIIKNDEKFVFSADKYAYAYVEFKDKKTTLKIYQPFNTKGFKWSNNHDRSVISLWTKVPANGLMICICASLKDALCLWANTGIPSIAVQGEGYSMSDTAIEELKRRFKHVYILFDNDEAGIIDGVKLAEQTGFTNIVLPRINEAKDISDLYKSLENKEQFKELMINLFKNN
jgi:hypothetical protein